MDIKQELDEAIKDFFIQVSVWAVAGAGAGAAMLALILIAEGRIT